MSLDLMLVTDSAQFTSVGIDPVAGVLAAAAGGITSVQVREKDADSRDFLAYVDALARQLPLHVELFVNDRVDVFLAARARGLRVTGVHVGQSDLPIDDTRRLIGPNAVLGLSASTPAELALAAESPAAVDYLGIGPVHATRSKRNAPDPLGIDVTLKLTSQSRLPVVAIGGLTPADAGALKAGGVAGMAVVSWVCSAADPERAAHELSTAWLS